MLTNQLTDNPLTSFEQAGAGQRWDWARVRRTEANEALFRGDFTSLIAGRTKTARNGLLLVGADSDYVVSNWFRKITRFYRDALFAERPGIASETQSRQDFMRAPEREHLLFGALAMAYRDKSRSGYFVLAATTDGRMRPIPGKNYQPVVDIADNERVIGHVLGFPYYVDRQRTQQRIRIVWLGLDGQQPNVSQDYDFSGNQIQGVVGSSAPSDIQRLWVFGDGDDDYSQIKALAAQGMVLQTLLAYATNRHMNPILAGPAAWIEALNAAAQATLEQRVAQGLLAQLDINDQPVEFVVPEINVMDALEELRQIGDLMHQDSGVPPVVLGITAGSQSGAAFDRLMFGAMSRVRSDRNELERIIPEAYDALGAPAGETSLQWPADPFASVAERAQAIRDDLAAGIIDEDEARIARGYPPREEGDNADTTGNEGQIPEGLEGSESVREAGALAGLLRMVRGG